MPKPTHGTLRLDFWAEQFLGLVGAGAVGLLPLTVWTIVPMLVLGGGEGHGSSSTLGGVATVAGTLAFLFLPPVVPSLVLRARQPHARIEWDDGGAHGPLFGLEARYSAA